MQHAQRQRAANTEWMAQGQNQCTGLELSAGGGNGSREILGIDMEHGKVASNIPSYYPTGEGAAV
jgi:hypothetical protein